VSGCSLESRADALEETLAAHVARGALVGAVCGLSDGDRRTLRAVGHAERETSSPMRVDSIMRVHSMSKPLMAAGFLALAETMGLSLDEPVHTFLPELVAHGLTLRHLLTHTSGLPYANPNGSASERRMADVAGDLCEGEPRDLAAWAAYLAHRPGEAWMYGVGLDLLGRVAEVVSGKSLDRFLAEGLFAKLSMHDTSFSVSPASRDRVATLYRASLEPIAVSHEAPTFLSGGGGLYATAPDYLAFCEMLLGDGTHEGIRVLSLESVRAMCTDQLGAGLPVLGPVAYGAGCSFGLGGRVVTDPGKSGYGTRGTYGWDGIGGATCFVDHGSSLACVLLTQMVPWPRGLHERIREAASGTNSLAPQPISR
jgi:CubicO group peptidase (beta-lactamase class C family)